MTRAMLLTNVVELADATWPRRGLGAIDMSRAISRSQRV